MTEDCRSVKTHEGDAVDENAVLNKTLAFAAVSKKLCQTFHELILLGVYGLGREKLHAAILQESRLYDGRISDTTHVQPDCKKMHRYPRATACQ